MTTTVINTDLLLEVADAIEEYPEHFHMGSFWGAFSSVDGTPAECGTSGCIAGWALSLHGFRQVDVEIVQARDDGNGYLQLGRDALGLTDVQANEMFMNWITRPTWWIVDTLRDIAKGDLVWDDVAGKWR